MNNPVRITFLGTGTSQGVPVIACECSVCQSNDERDKRLRSSIMIEVSNKVFIVDTGPDFRQQMLREKVKNLTAVLFTHEHKDHTAGLDDVRAFNFILNKQIDIYAENRVQKALKREFAYIYDKNKYPGVPQINMHLFENKSFKIEGVQIIPVRAFHYKLPVFGFRIGDFAYLTDIKSIPDEEKQKLKNLEVLVLNALRKEEHLSHLNLNEALQLVDELKPRKTFLTHLSHRFGLQAEEETLLPSDVRIAFDGLSFIVG
jgi:phosphoribosyl 1,2-cyclic phosphate phosphodiesterase